MPNQSATDTNKSSEPPSDSKRSEQPPEPIYEPYDPKGLHDASYKPYSEKAALPEPPYEPYKSV